MVWAVANFLSMRPDYACSENIDAMTSQLAWMGATDRNVTGDYLEEAFRQLRDGGFLRRKA